LGQIAADHLRRIDNKQKKPFHFVPVLNVLWN
jgi:hypothetical protein